VWSLAESWITSGYGQPQRPPPYKTGGRLARGRAADARHLCFHPRRTCPNRLRLRRASFLFSFWSWCLFLLGPLCTFSFLVLQIQPFSKKSRTPTVAIEFQIGLYDPAEADLELFCNSWSAGFLGERLYAAHLAAYRLYPFGFW